MGLIHRLVVQSEVAAATGELCQLPRAKGRSDSFARPSLEALHIGWTIQASSHAVPLP